MKKRLIKIITAPLTRTIFGMILLCGALICCHFKETVRFELPLFCLSLIMCLFPLTAKNVIFLKSKESYVCDKCGEGEAVNAVIVHQLVCILLPFIRIPYKVQRRTACKKCYLQEKEKRSGEERLLLLKTGIIRNEKRKKGRCNEVNPKV